MNTPQIPQFSPHEIIQTKATKHGKGEFSNYATGLRAFIYVSLTKSSLDSERCRLFVKITNPPHVTRKKILKQKTKHCHCSWITEWLGCRGNISRTWGLNACNFVHAIVVMTNAIDYNQSQNNVLQHLRANHGNMRCRNNCVRQDEDIATIILRDNRIVRMGLSGRARIRFPKGARQIPLKRAVKGNRENWSRLYENTDGYIPQAVGRT